MRRPVVLLVLCTVAAGCALRRSVPPPSPYCRAGWPLVGVYHPERLKVHAGCVRAAGTVEQVKFEQYDGDVHFELRLDPGQARLLGSGNGRVDGTLVVEIIPWDRARVRVPTVGRRVEVVGPWVADNAHGWNEIHPAWWVSDGTIKKRFESIGVESTEENRRAYRDLLFTTEGAEDYISGVILFDETLRQSSADGTPFPKLLDGKGVIPGIKVDKGAKPLALTDGETITEGLDGLRDRLNEYRDLGARFAKWRATYSIDADRPSE